MPSQCALVWGIVCTEIYGRSDVAFGTTVSGRNLPLEGMENFVGLTSNVNPVRYNHRAQMAAKEMLVAMRERQFASMEFETVSQLRLFDMPELAPGNQLFETLLVVENFPSSQNAANAELKLESFKSG